MRTAFSQWRMDKSPLIISLALTRKSLRGRRRVWCRGERYIIYRLYKRKVPNYPPYGVEEATNASALHPDSHSRAIDSRRAVSTSPVMLSAGMHERHDLTCQLREISIGTRSNARYASKRHRVHIVSAHDWMRMATSTVVQRSSVATVAGV